MLRPCVRLDRRRNLLPAPSPNDKPLGTSLGWTLRETTYLFASAWRRFRRDRVLVGGEELVFSYLEVPRAVWVVPVTPAGEIVLIRQYRYPVDEWCLEIPAGGMQDQGDRTPEEVIRLELQQEIGATCGAIEYVDFFFASKAHSNEKTEVYLAREVRLGAEPANEPTELIEALVVPAADAIALAESGQIKDSQSALALIRCQPRLRELGVLPLPPPPH